MFSNSCCVGTFWLLSLEHLGNSKASRDDRSLSGCHCLINSLKGKLLCHLIRLFLLIVSFRPSLTCSRNSGLPAFPLQTLLLRNIALKNIPPLACQRCGRVFVPLKAEQMPRSAFKKVRFPPAEGPPGPLPREPSRAKDNALVREGYARHIPVATP